MPSSEQSTYPPKFDPQIVRALHWCRLGRIRPDDDAAFHRAKQMGLLAQDPCWRATPQGEGVLVALGLLKGKPAPRRLTRWMRWAVNEQYTTPQLVASWSEWEEETGRASDLCRDAEDDFTCESGETWTFFTTVDQIDIPEVPGEETCS